MIISSVTADYLCVQIYLKMGQTWFNNVICSAPQEATSSSSLDCLMFRGGIKKAPNVWCGVRAQCSHVSQQRWSQGSQHSLEGNTAPQREMLCSEPALAKVGFSCQNTGALCCLRHLAASRGFTLDPQPPEEQPREAGSLQRHHSRVVNGLTMWETCYLGLL